MLLLISFLLLALLAGFVIIPSSGIIVFSGFLIGLAVIHLGILKKKWLVVVIGVIIIALSFLLPSIIYMGL